MGSVSPLLAVAEKLKEVRPGAEFLFLGTRKGPERRVVEEKGLIFKAISSGKFRRYFSFRLLIDPFLVLLGLLQSIFIIRRFKPNLVIAAGSFISVPVVWAAGLLKVPALTHQQDIRPGLANLLMSRLVKIITVTFEESLKDFPADKAVLTGNPFRPEILQGNREQAKNEFSLKNDLPVVLIAGGGTGALGLNQLVAEALPNLVNFCQVIHLTGKDKGTEKINLENYHSYEFLTGQMKDALAVADLVVTRAGFSSLTELAVLGKPIIIIPMPQTHQEANAQFFVRNNAALMLDQKTLTAQTFSEAIRNLLADEAKKADLSRNIKKMIPLDSTANFVKEILKFQ